MTASQKMPLSPGKNTLDLLPQDRPEILNILEAHREADSPRLHQSPGLKLNECSAPVIQRYDPSESERKVTEEDVVTINKSD